MNVKQILTAAAILVATGSAFAQTQYTVRVDNGFTSSKTRDQVKAELNQAYAQGTLVHVDGTEQPSQMHAQVARGLTRQDVRAQASHSVRPAQNDLYFGD